MALKFLPNYPNLDSILDSIPDLKTDQIKRIIEMLYISASNQTRAKVDMDVEIDCRENRIQSYLQDDQLFRDQVAEDLRDWTDLPEDFRYVEWIYNEDYDDIFCPDCEEYFVSDPYQLADLILRILWDARVAAKRHDWLLVKQLIETVYIEMEESVTQFGDFREDDNLVDRLQEYCWNEYRADETIKWIVMDAFLDQSLTLDEKTSLMIELVTTGNINVDILSWMSDENEEIIYSSEFLEMFLRKALTSERLTGNGRYKVFRNILEFCSSDRARVLVFKYGDLVPEIFQYYLIMVREELTPEQIIAYAEYTLPRITAFTSKFIIEANLSVAKEKLEKAADSGGSD